MEEGLAHRDILTYFQDKDGFLWLSTHGGLQRYDGHDFKSYDVTTDDGKPMPEIISISQNQQGWILLLTSSHKNEFRNNLFFVNPLTGELKTQQEYLTPAISDQLDELLKHINYKGRRIQPDNSIYFGGKSSAALFNLETGVLQKTPLPFTLIDNTTVQLVDFERNIWVFDRERNPSIYSLIKLSPSGELLDSIPIRKSPPTITGKYSIFEWDEITYFYSFIETDDVIQMGLFRVDGPDKHSMLFNIPFGYSVFEMVDGMLWCIGEEGWKVFDLTGKLLFELKRSDYDLQLFEGLPYKIIRSTTSGQFYLNSELGFNIITIQKNPFTQYFVPSESTPLPFKNSARGIYAENDSVVVNFEFGGLAVFQKTNPDNYNIITTKSLDVNVNKMHEYNGRPIIRDHHHNFWTGHIGFLNKWSPDFSTQERIPFSKKFFLTNEHLWGLYQDADSIIWAPHYLALGNIHINGKSVDDMEYFNADFPLNELEIYQIQKESEDLLWFCVTEGLLLFDKRKRKCIGLYNDTQEGAHYLPAASFLSMYIDDNGNRWFGTRSGLLFWNPATEEKRLFTRNDGLSNEVIYAVYEDNYNRLWLSSDYGIMSFDKKTFDVQTYLPKDGITQEEFNRISHFQEKDGTIYFGGLNGVTGFHPKDFTAQKKDYIPTVIADFEIFDGSAGALVNKLQEVSETKTIIFRPGDRFFKLKFIMPSFYGADKTRYAWNIAGVNDEWNYQKENVLQFGALPYGNHVLRIKAQGADGSWSPDELVIQIKVLRPFYLKGWFIALIISLLIGSVIAFYKNKTRVYRQQQKLLKEEIASATQKIRSDKNTIETQAEELKKLDELKSRFFANVSHELKTPLSLMIGPINRLLKIKNLGKENIQLLKFLQNNSLHLRNLVHEILDLSKLENNKMELAETSTDLLNFINQRLAQFYSYGSSEQVIVKSILPKTPLPLLLIDVPKMEKIINNFLSNAIKFTPTGGTVTLSLKDIDEQLLITVTDTGRGIHADDLPYIFDRFYQSKRTDEPIEGGTGIGLSLCKELAALMDGKIWAESILGKGSSFYFQFPKKIAAEKAVEKAPVFNSSPAIATEKPIVLSKNISQDATILIAEDNADLRAFYGIILQDYTVVLKEHGQAALDYLKTAKRQPDLIISDLMMPVMDGMQFLSHLKSSDQWRNIPVIMLTAKTNRQVKIKALRIGIDDYLTKPFDEEELLVRIQNLLAHYQKRKDFHKKSSAKTAPTISQEEAEWLQSFESFIVQHIEDSRLSSQWLAHEFGMSSSTLLRQVKKTTGLSPSKYIQEHRLNYARQLLENRQFRTVSQVAYRIGFKDSTSFSRSFKQRFGLTPTELIAEK